MKPRLDSLNRKTWELLCRRGRELSEFFLFSLTAYYEEQSKLDAKGAEILKNAMSINKNVLKMGLKEGRMINKTQHYKQENLLI